MKYRYRLHPCSYDLGENEKFYGDMEAKGWRLVKRGNYLSKFTPSEPNRARYRVEVIHPGQLMEGLEMPSEQRAVYEDCGWEYVAASSPLYIFRAPEGSEAPEFYADPAEQAAALKNLRWQGLLAWVPATLILLLNLFFDPIWSGSRWRGLSNWYRAFFEETLTITLTAIIVLAMYCMLRNAWRIDRTYRRLKRGIPLDHNPQDRHLLHKTVRGVLLAVIVLTGVLSAAERMGKQKQPLPPEADGPYLLMRDTGRDGEHGEESSITHTNTLFAEYWDIYETTGGNKWMYQDIYRLRSPKMADSLVNALRNTVTFGRNADDCTKYVMPDMTAWVYRDIELIAVSGDMVAHVTWMDSDWADPDPERVLNALQERWAG